MADIKNPEGRGFESSGQKAQGGRFGEQAREKSSQAAEKARSTADQVRNRVGHQAHEAAQKGKHRAAEAISDIATSIREAGHKLHQEEQEGAASYVDRAADQIDSIARYIESHDINDFVETAEQTARRQPLIFLGAAFVSGLVTARFLRSSSERRGGHARASGSADSTGASAMTSGESAGEASYIENETESAGTASVGGQPSEWYSPEQPARQKDVELPLPPEQPPRTPESASGTGGQPTGPETAPPPPPEEGEQRP